MDYLLKVRNASLKVAQDVVSGLVTGVGASTQSLGTNNVSKRPVEDFILRFQTICHIFDNLSKVESDVEAERMLHESKVHEHIREVLRHLHVEDNVWFENSLKKNGKEKVEDNTENHPCFDTFVKDRFMEELCTRARQDRPRGCLLLVLVMVTSMLRNIRFPLLPHPTIHKSIHQLILDSSSISSMYNSISKTKQQASTQRDFSGYVKKVDIQLVSLIASLWNKISENSELLSFFIFIDKRNGVKRHLDAVSCLIPLMGKPKTGAIAKEALLTAISVHDPRIDSFILEETNLPINIITELSKKFQNSLILSALNVSEPAVAGTARNLRAGDITPSAEKALHAIESFSKVLHFCGAVVRASTTSTTAATAPNMSIRSHLCKLFAEDFLQQTVKKCLLENGEEHVLAVQSLLRQMVLEIFEISKETDARELSAPRDYQTLCSTASSFLCEEKDILQVLVRRVGSVSRAVSISTIQLLTSLLAASSLTRTIKLVILSTEVLTESKEEVLLTANSKSLAVGEALESLLLNYISDENEEMLDEYVKVSISHMLSKVESDRGGIRHDTVIISDGEEYGPIFSVCYRKLQSFLSLKYDEQIAITGLVHQCIVVLFASILSTQIRTTEVIRRCFTMLSKLFDTVRLLNAELNSHKNSISDVDMKFQIVRDLLANPFSDHQKKKIIDKESPQVVRILESCIIMGELLNEMEGSALAFRNLYIVASKNSGELLFDTAERVYFGESLDDETSLSTDDEDNVPQYEDQEISESQNLTIDNFLLECDDLEMQLESVISSLSMSD